MAPKLTDVDALPRRECTPAFWLMKVEHLAFEPEPPNGNVLNHEIAFAVSDEIGASDCSREDGPSPRK